MNNSTENSMPKDGPRTRVPAPKKTADDVVEFAGVVLREGVTGESVGGGITVVENDVITSVVTDPGWQFVTVAGHDVMVYVVVERTVDVRVVEGDEVVEVEDAVADPEHPGALALSVRTTLYPLALRSK